MGYHAFPSRTYNIRSTDGSERMNPILKLVRKLSYVTWQSIQGENYQLGFTHVEWLKKYPLGWLLLLKISSPNTMVEACGTLLIHILILNAKCTFALVIGLMLMRFFIDIMNSRSNQSDFMKKKKISIIRINSKILIVDSPTT